MFQIRDDFWVLYGGMGLGSTVGVSVGDDGILLIDAMHAVSNEMAKDPRLGEIVARGDHLVLRQPGAFIVDLIALSETRSHPRGLLSGDVRFETAESGRVLGFTSSSEHVEMTARKRYEPITAGSYPRAQ